MSAQVRDPLAVANAARQRGYELGLQLRAGQADLIAVLSALDPEHAEIRRAAAWLRVGVLLRYVPGIGKSTVTAICRRARIDRGVTLRELDPVRTARLVAELERFDLAGYSGVGYARRIR